MRYLKLIAISLLISIGVIKNKTTMADIDRNKSESSEPGSVVLGSQCV